MDSDPHDPTTPLADIVASRPAWLRARLSTILVWPNLHYGWTAILSYAHYTTVQPGETPPPDHNVAYPHDTHHPVAFDGADATAVQAQVRDLERTGAAAGNARPCSPCAPVELPKTLLYFFRYER